MDSQWYKQAVMGRNGYEPNVDLNLTLSLPNTDSDPTRIAPNAGPIPRINTPRFHSLNFSGPYSEALNQNQMANGGAGNTMNPYQMNIGGVGGGLENSHGGENYTIKTNMQTSWTPEVLNHFMDSTGLSRFSAPATVVPAAPYIDPHLSGSFSGQLQVPAMQDYSLFGNFEIGSSSSGTGNKRRAFTNVSVPIKSCSNLRCGAEETPMWRKGPLGPKTLCNACGIKYRKKMERRRAMEEAARRSLRPDA